MTHPQIDQPHLHNLFYHTMILPDDLGTRIPGINNKIISLDFQEFNFCFII